MRLLAVLLLLLAAGCASGSDQQSPGQFAFGDQNSFQPAAPFASFLGSP